MGRIFCPRVIGCHLAIDDGSVVIVGPLVA